MCLDNDTCCYCPCAKYRFAGSVPACEIAAVYPFLGSAGVAGAYFPYAPYSYPYLTPLLITLAVDRSCFRRNIRDINQVGYPWC
jgi:hypothetical protein